MFMTSLRRWLRNRKTNPSSRVRRVQDGRSRFRPSVESLEDRTLLSTIFWKAAASGNWSVATNWIGNVAPAAGDTAVIDATGANYTVTLDTSPTVAGFTLNSANATFFASGRTLTVNGPDTLSAGSALWRNSTWTGSGTLTNNASMTADGNSTISSSLAQNGSLLVQGSDAGGHTTLTVANGFSNAGTITLQSLNQGWASNLTLTSGTLTNTGTLTVNAGSGGGRTLSAELRNSGTVNVNTSTTLGRTGATHQNSGNLNLNGATLTVTGNALTNAAAGVILSTGSSTLSNTPAFTNQGTVNVPNGTLNVTGPFTNFSGTTLTGGTYLVGGTFKFPNADIRTNAATIVLDGPGSAIVNPSNVNALASFATNAAAGNFTIQNGRTITTPAFSNAGNVTIGATSTFLTSAGNYTQTAGTTTVLGTLDPAATVDIQAGTLRGTGNVNSNVVNAGQVSPGLSPGQLTINGNYSQSGSGILTLELNGSAAGTGYDQLKVNGAVTLGGTLNATLGFVSGVSDTFTIIDNDLADVVTGTFAGLPEGATVTIGGVGFQLTYTGGSGNDVVLSHIDTGPVLALLGDRTVDEESLLTFTAVATDVDSPPQTFAFSLDAGAPAGAAIDPVTGLFTWTPTEAQGPGTYPVTVRVTDSGPAALSDAKSFSITVREVNRAPVLTALGDRTVDEETTLSFTAAATDPDLPANALTFTLDAGAPAGASIDPATALFTWTPSETQDGTYHVTVRVTDNGSPQLSDTKTFALIVNDVNTPPTLTNPGNRTVDEQTPLSLTLTATDHDVAAGVADTVTYSVFSGLQSGMLLNTATGAFSWTPGEAQDGSYNVTFRATDNHGATQDQTVTILVREVNTPPTLTNPGNQALDEQTPLSFSLTAADPDIVAGVADTVTYSVFSGLQSGMLLDPVTGAIIWTPTEAQDGSYNVTFRATDNHGATQDQTITIIVREVNRPPILTAIADQTALVGDLLSLTAVATDPDIPANTLTFSLDEGAPTGASIDPATGVFTWTPTAVQGVGTYVVTVRVTNNGTPALSDARTFTIAVNSPPLTVADNYTVDEDATVREGNNAASQLLQIGSVPVVQAFVSVQGSVGLVCGASLPVSGLAQYDLSSGPTALHFPVQGGLVTVQVIAAATGAVLQEVRGLHTDMDGRYSVAIEPPSVDTLIRIEVSDTGFAGTCVLRLPVALIPPPDSCIGPEGTPEPPPVPPSPETPPGDIFVYSEDIQFFGSLNPAAGATTTILASIHLDGSVPAYDVPVTVNAIYASGGALRTVEIGRTVVSSRMAEHTAQRSSAWT
ncbi:MAG TPA: putative Ig domain-containing protein, partial [Gemmataceae bacterium]|nr:putative Ig domain-containing protein [Gemmataceae bacterium]